MTIAWLALAMSGAFFAAWMKPVLPNGEWFIAHRIFMVGSLIVGILGFILPFIAHARSPTPGLISFSSDVSLYNNDCCINVLYFRVRTQLILLLGSS